MPSIIGATHLIRGLKARKRPSRATGDYKKRNDELPDLGYATYREYLKSDDWAELRGRILRQHPTCCRCDDPATQVHHFSYHAAVILGRCNDLLLPICEPCHKSVEFDGDRKRTLSESQIEVMHTAKDFFLWRIRSGKGRLKRMTRKLAHGELMRSQSKNQSWKRQKKSKWPDKPKKNTKN